jgi:hypothetical protein
MGRCPCPRCHITKNQIRGLGKASDMRIRKDGRMPTKKLFAMVKAGRRAVFRGRSTSGLMVEELTGSVCRTTVKVISVLPFGTCDLFRTQTFWQNSFMECFPALNIYALLTVDLLHEVELGVWKSLFIHILRLLQLFSRDCTSELDRRCVYNMNTMRFISVLKSRV